MVTRKRRITQPETKHLTLGAVFLAPGWLIEWEGERRTVVRLTRRGQGPKYDLETDSGTFIVGAAEKVTVIRTNVTIP